MTQVWMTPAVALLMTASAMGGQGGEQPLTVSAVRFYSAARATTTIEGVCELRLDAVAAGTGPVVRYRIEVSIQDSTGQELLRNGWSREVPRAVAGASGATAVETFDFPPAAPGRYRVVVRAVPETGPAVERAIDVPAFSTRPFASDLLLATAARDAAADTGAVSAGEIRRGSLAMRTAPVPHLSPGADTLSYYAEVYPWQGASLDGQLTVAVLKAGGQRVVQTAPRVVRFPQAGGVTVGSIPLAGLPAGEYRLELGVRLGDSTVVTSAPFVMRRPSAVAAGPAPTPDSAADRFGRMNETQLDSMYAPLVYLLEPGESQVYDQLAVDGKRRFLSEFWARRETGARARFYAAVDYTNQAFREGGAGQRAGWRTDRGRVYLRNGKSDEILRRPMASTAPFEIWKYTRGRQRYYVFRDRSGLGTYQLIFTNDRQEIGLQDWGHLMGTSDSTDVMRFLGITVEDQPQGPQ
jgi:GWxTD domain-containing protein